MNNGNNPAFARPYSQATTEGIAAVSSQSGMTMREWYATFVMQALMKGHHVSDNFCSTNLGDIYATIAKCSFKMADEMVKASKSDETVDL